MKVVIYSKNENRRLEMLRKIVEAKLNLIIIECGNIKRLPYLLKENEYDVCVLADFEEESTTDLYEFFDEFKIISYVKPLILTKQEDLFTNFSNVEITSTFEELINVSSNFIENCLKDKYSYKVQVVGQMCYLHEYVGDCTTPDVVVNIINCRINDLEIDIPMGYTFEKIARFTKRVLLKDAVRSTLGNIETVRFKFNTVYCNFTKSTTVEEMLDYFHQPMKES